MGEIFVKPNVAEVDFGTAAEADFNAACDLALNTLIPSSITSGSINSLIRRLQIAASCGKVYFVETTGTTGSDSNSGLSPDVPLLKIQTALANCTSGNHDYIFVLNAWDGDAATITVAKNTVHIIGMSCKNHSAPWPWLKIAGTGAAPVFTITGGTMNYEIAGLALAANSTNPCITFGASAGQYSSYGHIHDIAFAHSSDAAYLARDGILIPDGREANGLLVEGCTFGGQITRSGVRIEEGGGMSYGRIINCDFLGGGTVCIHHAQTIASSSMPDVINCRFRRAHGAAEGWAITTVNAGGGLIDGNHASADFTTADSNPYLDINDKCQWGLNYNVITAAAPATT